MIFKRDWRMTEDGDLIMGSPKTDEEGRLLYIDIFGDKTTDAGRGTLVRDIPLHVAENAEEQVIRNRMKTDAPDWFLHPELGSNLSELIGEPNTRATGDKGVSLIRHTLTYDGFVAENNLSVRAVPVDAITIIFYIEVKSDLEIEVYYPLVFNLEHGILSEYEVTT